MQDGASENGHVPVENGHTTGTAENGHFTTGTGRSATENGHIPTENGHTATVENGHVTSVAFEDAVTSATPLQEKTPPAAAPLEFDALLTQHVGEFGRRQRFLSLILASAWASSCLHSFACVFVAGQCESGHEDHPSDPW